MLKQAFEACLGNMFKFGSFKRHWRFCLLCYDSIEKYILMLQEYILEQLL